MRGENKYSLDELRKQLDEFLQDFKNEPSMKSSAIEMELRLRDAIYQTSLAQNSNLAFPSSAFPKDPEIIGNMEKLLQKKNLKRFRDISDRASNLAYKIAIALVGVLFITIGFILIVTPATPEFEIATIIYFNEYDGLTVMDLFALAVIFIGIYFLIRGFIGKKD